MVLYTGPGLYIEVAIFLFRDKGVATIEFEAVAQLIEATASVKVSALA